MTNADLVWRLVELVLKKENDTKQVALAQDQSQNDTKKQDDKGQKNAQLAKKECSTTTLLCSFLSKKMKELNATTHLVPSNTQ